MRLACITGKYPQPSEAFLQRDLAGLAERGHIIRIWPCEAKAGSGYDRWYDPKGSPFPPYRSPLPGKKKTKGILGALLGGGWLQLRRLPAIFNMMSQWPEKESPDAVLACFASLPALISHTLAQAWQRPWHLWSHARDVWVPWRPAMGIWKTAIHHICCNAAAQGELQKHLQSVKVNLCHHGLPEHKFVSPAQSDEGFFLAAGRLFEKKGFPVLLQAMSRLVKDYPQARVRLIGDGPLYRELQSERKALGITPEQLKICDWKTEQELESEIRSCRAVVIPSIVAKDGDRDGIPNILLEAFAAGKPVIASNVGGIPEVLSDKNRGWLVPTGQPELLADALADATENPDRCREYGEAAACWAEQHFNQKTTLPRLEAILSES